MSGARDAGVLYRQAWPTGGGSPMPVESERTRVSGRLRGLRRNEILAASWFQVSAQVAYDTYAEASPGDEVEIGFHRWRVVAILGNRRKTWLLELIHN